MPLLVATKVGKRFGGLMAVRDLDIQIEPKTIYSVIDLREILLGCNRRYLEYLSALDDFSAGDRNLHRLTSSKTVDGHTLKGFNFFDHTQQALLRALQGLAFNIRGIRRADLISTRDQNASVSLRLGVGR